MYIGLPKRNRLYSNQNRWGSNVKIFSVPKKHKNAETK